MSIVRHFALRRFRHDSGGSAAVEFALVAIPFITFIFGAIQLFIFFLAQQTLETAAEASGRQILVGTAPASASGFQTLVCSNIPALLKCSGVMVDVQVANSFGGATTTAPVLTYDKNGNVNNSFQYNTGTSGSIVVLRLMYLWPMWNFFPSTCAGSGSPCGFQPANASSTTHLLYATAVFKNE